MLRVEFVIQRYFYDVLKAEIDKIRNKSKFFDYKLGIGFQIFQSFPGFEESFL